MRRHSAAMGVLLVLVLASVAQGGEKWRVGVSVMPPLVMAEEGQSPRGFAVDVWEVVARELGVDYEFVMFPNIEEKLRAVEEGKIDIAIGGITITKEREERVDFCYSGFRTGLGILVRRARGLGALPFGLGEIFTRERLIVIAGFLLMLIVAGHLMWWVERGKAMFSKHYFPGVFEGVYWAVVTASTVGYGDKAPVKWKGQVLAAVIIIISLPFFAVFTAELTSAITVQTFRSHIRSLQDLAGHDVGVVEGTTGAQSEAARIGMPHVFPTIEDAYRALLAQDVDAVIYDAPTLHYYCCQEGKGKVVVVGKPFQVEDYGYAVRRGSPLRKRVNVVILALMQRANMDDLKQVEMKWFGETY